MKALYESISSRLPRHPPESGRSAPLSRADFSSTMLTVAMQHLLCSLQPLLVIQHLLPPPISTSSTTRVAPTFSSPSPSSAGPGSSLIVVSPRSGELPATSSSCHLPRTVSKEGNYEHVCIEGELLSATALVRVARMAHTSCLFLPHPSCWDL